MSDSNLCQYFIFIFNSSLFQIFIKEVIHLKQYFDDDFCRCQKTTASSLTLAEAPRLFIYLLIF